MHGPLLALLTFCFALRVLGQAWVAFFGATWLPAMEQWSSGMIPYFVLLIIQLLMLSLMVKITNEILRAEGIFATRRPHWARFLKQFGAVYAVVMILRYALTMILRPELRWFGPAIPVIFHVVLAGFIFVLGDYHQRAR